MKYPLFDEAVKLCIRVGKTGKIAKSDMSRAFRNVPLRKTQWWLLVLKAKHLLTGKIFFFFDKCLSFGSSISCTIFQAISDAIAYIVKCRNGDKPLINYLDDYFFADFLKKFCNKQVQVFLDVCQEIKFPVAIEKTFWASSLLTFLGLLIDMQRQLILLPVEKLNKAKNWVEYFLNKRNKKATLLEFQKLCGILNFVCRCIIPGRVFVRRLYICSANLKPHHHIRINEEHRLDLSVWRQILNSPDIFSRPFMDFNEVDSITLDMASDASGNYDLGFGAYCGTEWSVGQWNRTFMENHKPSIEYLELFALTVGVVNWIKLFKNKRILLFCDNQAVVHMVNNMSAKCKNSMALLRIVVMEGVVNNVRIRAKYIDTKSNEKADALSRLDFKHFARLAKDSMSQVSTPIPNFLWPLDRLWIH